MQIGRAKGVKLDKDHQIPSERPRLDHVCYDLSLAHHPRTPDPWLTLTHAGSTRDPITAAQIKINESDQKTRTGMLRSNLERPFYVVRSLTILNPGQAARWRLRPHGGDPPAHTAHAQTRSHGQIPRCYAYRSARRTRWRCTY